MKWFKHDARARNDAKIAKVILRHGIEGYGLYFACLEIIAEELTPENFTFELEHDAELLAAMFKMDTLKVEKIMRDFITLGLFEVSEASNRVACYKLAKRLDNATAQNKEVQAILRNFKQLKVSESNLNQIRLEERRLEEIRGEEAKPVATPVQIVRPQNPNINALFFSLTGRQPNSYQVRELVRIAAEYPQERIEYAFTEAGRAGADLRYVSAVLSGKGKKEPLNLDEIFTDEVAS